jgi:hypothetical protein
MICKINGRPLADWQAAALRGSLNSALTRATKRRNLLPQLECERQLREQDAKQKAEREE